MRQVRLRNSLFGGHHERGGLCLWSHLRLPKDCAACHQCVWRHRLDSRLSHWLMLFPELLCISYFTLIARTGWRLMIFLSVIISIDAIRPQNASAMHLYICEDDEILESVDIGRIHITNKMPADRPWCDVSLRIAHRYHQQSFIMGITTLPSDLLHQACINIIRRDGYFLKVSIARRLPQARCTSIWRIQATSRGN